MSAFVQAHDAPDTLYIATRGALGERRQGRLCGAASGGFYVLQSGGAAVARDSGLPYMQEATTGVPRLYNLSQLSLDARPSQPHTLLVTAQQGGAHSPRGGLYRSTDEGRTWRAVAPPVVTPRATASHTATPRPPTATPSPTVTLSPTATLSPTLTASPTPSATLTPTPSATPLPISAVLPATWNWTQLSPSGSAPPARQDATVVWDATDRQLLVYGGYNPTGSVTYGDLWAYRPLTNSWTPLTATNAAPARSGAAGVWDPIGKRLLIVGGQQGSGSGATMLNDVQAYTPASATWTTLSPQRANGAPAPRSRAAAAWDSAAGRLLLYGGSSADSGPPVPLTADLWAFTPGATSGSWAQLDAGTASEEPPARNWAALAWDTTAGVARLFGGKTAAGQTFSDTWEWSPASGWHFDEAPIQPAGRGAAAATWDVQQAHFLVGPGLDLYNESSDTWAYEPSVKVWFRLPVASAPSPRQQTAMAWDDADGAALLFGGRLSGSGAGNDLWALAPTTANLFPTVTPSLTPTTTPTTTPTPTTTETATPSLTVTATASPSPSATATLPATTPPSVTLTPTISPTATMTVSPTLTVSGTLTLGPSPTVSGTLTLGPSLTPTLTTTPTPSATATGTVTPSATAITGPTVSTTPTPSPSVTATGTATPTPSATPTGTVTPSATTTATASATPTVTSTSTATLAPSPSPTATLPPIAVHKAVDIGQVLDANGRVLVTTQEVQAVKAAGAALVRINFQVPASPDSSTGMHGTHWTNTVLNAYGTVVSMFRSAGIGVIGLVSAGATGDNTQNDWLAGSAETAGGSGNNAFISAAYVPALEVVIQHFHVAPYYVTLWELWNEPNAYTSSPGPGVYSGGSFIYASNFAALLAASYNRIKVSDGLSDVTLISGGLLGISIGGNYSPAQSGAPYLQSTYAAGVQYDNWNGIKAQSGSYPLDAIGQHIYVDQGGYTTPALIRAYEDYLRTAYIAGEGGSTGKTTIVTEAGWSTGGPSSTVLPDQQAVDATALYEGSKASGYVSTVTWFQAQDNPAAQLYYGLYDASLQAKPVLGRYQAQ